MSYGDVEVVRELLDIAEGEQEEKIARLMKLSNVWLNTFPDIIDDLDDDTKDLAVNLHTVYLFSLSAGRFADTIPPIATEFRDEGTRVLEHAINKEAEIFKIRKVKPI